MYMYYIYVRSHRMADHSNRFSWQHGQVSEKRDTQQDNFLQASSSAFFRSQQGQRICCAQV